MAQHSGWSADGGCMSNAVRVPAQGAGQTHPTATPSHVPAFSYALQPIVDTVAREVFSYEALIRGPANEPALRVFAQVPSDLKHQFDQDSRTRAISHAARLGLKCNLNLNFLPSSQLALIPGLNDFFARGKSYVFELGEGRAKTRLTSAAT